MEAAQYKQFVIEQVDLLECTLDDIMSNVKEFHRTQCVNKDVQGIDHSLCAKMFLNTFMASFNIAIKNTTLKGGSLARFHL